MTFVYDSSYKKNPQEKKYGALFYADDILMYWRN